MKLFAFRLQQIRRVAKDSIRMYFAPVTGALKGIRAELQEADRDVQRHRNATQRLSVSKMLHFAVFASSNLTGFAEIS